MDQLLYSLWLRLHEQGKLRPTFLHLARVAANFPFSLPSRPPLYVPKVTALAQVGLALVRGSLLQYAILR